MADRAVVWDLDGVIVDSARAHDASWVAMSRQFGVEYDSERDFKRIFGKHNTDIIGMLWNVADAGQVAAMAGSKEEFFRREARGLNPLPGVLELMQALRDAGWKQGIGSSAPVANIELLLEVTGTARYIDAVASGDDVSAGKPDPQVFLIALERLGVAPQNGVVIEDAPAGVQAALAAGAACVAVTTTQERFSLEQAGADLVVESLAQVSVGELEKLVTANQARDGRSGTSGSH